MPSEESGGSTLFFTKQAAESEISKTTTSSSRYNFYSVFERKTRMNNVYSSHC